jgi:hypothetical protein
MKIYEVVENDVQMRFYFFPTKKAARAHVREYYRNIDPEYGHEGASAVIGTVDVKATRVGIADALNWLMTRTCFNEG